MVSASVDKFPVSHWKAHEVGSRRPNMPADDLTSHTSIIALAAVLAAAVKRSGAANQILEDARGTLESLGVDPDHGGAASVLSLLRAG